jgi:hypothetical protein
MKRLRLVPLFALLLATPARAQAPVVALGSERASLTLLDEQLVITAPIVINLGTDRVGEPISVPVDVYYGVSDDLTVGLSHSNGTIQGVGPYLLQGRWPSSRGLGLCLTQGCGKVYDNVALDVVYRVSPDLLQLAIHGGLDINSFHPVVRARLGLLAKAPLATNVALLADPRLAVGLTPRGSGADILTIPIAIQMLTPTGARFAFQTGIDGALDSYATDFQGWVALFGAIGVNEKIEALANFALANIYGKNATASDRVLTLGLNIRP